MLLLNYSVFCGIAAIQKLQHSIFTILNIAYYSTELLFVYI